MDWKLALAQHPMYLIIREDELCAERTPPWGAPDIQTYVERVRQNLDALEANPWLKIGFEWSAVELELLAQDAPQVFSRLCRLAQAGRTRFYNGTYAQPHLQTLSAEANLRQFEFGARVYRELLGQQVLTYAHQEASVHEQVPQLLRAFGLQYAVIPGFLTTLIWIDETPLVFHGVKGLRFLHGHELASWRGLDGSEVPLLLRAPYPRQVSLVEALAQEAATGQLSFPPLLVHLPDMVGVDEAWLAERKHVDFVVLDEALQERVREIPRRPRARLSTNWSYIEGIRAEELSRANWAAEVSALQAECLGALAFSLDGAEPAPVAAVWKTILTAQHHDAYCFSAPMLRDKAIQWLRQAAAGARELAVAAARSIASRVASDGRVGAPILIFNTLPHAQTNVVELDVEVEHASVVDAEGRPTPSESTPAGNGASRVRFLARSDGLGYRTYWLRSLEAGTSTQDLNGPLLFENDHYRATIGVDGAFTSLALRATHEELLDASTGGGNVLSATESSALAARDLSPEEEFAAFASTPPARGQALTWEPTAPTTVARSSLGVVCNASGRLGERATAVAAVSLYHDLPFIDTQWRFEFDEASIGTFFDDGSKLLLRWALGFDGQAAHDIPFGVTRPVDGLPFFPTTWMDISDGRNGLALLHRGTPKHWLADRTVFNLLAWGQDTDLIGNRLGHTRWLKAFDQRLRGAHTIQHRIVPHVGTWREADVIGFARAFNAPPLAVLAGSHGGPLPSELTLCTLLDPSISATSVRAEGGRILFRVVANYGERAAPGLDSPALRLAGLRTLDGTNVDHLEPYQIGEIACERSAVEDHPQRAERKPGTPGSARGD